MATTAVTTPLPPFSHSSPCSPPSLPADSKLLLGDEVTASLDSTSEKAVQAALDNILQQGSSISGRVPRSSIIIAHRLSTIRDSDEIIVLDKGQVAEKGKHEQLLTLPSGLYRTLALAQDAGNHKVAGSSSAASAPSSPVPAGVQEAAAAAGVKL